MAEAGEEKSSMGTFHSRGAEKNCQWEQRRGKKETVKKET